MDSPLKLVNRLKKFDATKHLTLTRMHLSWLLDLDGDSLEQMISSGETDRSFNLLHFLHKSRRDSSAQGISQENYKQIMELITLLQQDNNVAQEGLFRKCGQMSRQKAVLSGACELLSDCTAHDLASVLKQRLGELTDPLLMSRNYEALLQLPRLSVGNQIAALQLVLQLLPARNARILIELARLLKAVADADSSRMSSEALGAMFAPHILCSRKLGAEALKDRKDQHEAAVAVVINHADELGRVPQQYVSDVKQALSELHIDSSTRASSDCFKHKPEEASEIRSTLTFVNQKATAEARQTTDTQLALVDLHSHISQLPDSAKKQRLLKQFRSLDATGSPRVDNSSLSNSVTRHLRRRLGRLSSKKSAQFLARQSDQTPSGLFSGDTSSSAAMPPLCKYTPKAEATCCDTPIVPRKTTSLNLRSSASDSTVSTHGLASDTQTATETRTSTDSAGLAATRPLSCCVGTSPVSAGFRHFGTSPIVFSDTVESATSPLVTKPSVKDVTEVTESNSATPALDKSGSNQSLSSGSRVALGTGSHSTCSLLLDSTPKGYRRCTVGSPLADLSNSPLSPGSSRPDVCSSPPCAATKRASSEQSPLCSKLKENRVATVTTPTHRFSPLLSSGSLRRAPRSVTEHLITPRPKNINLLCTETSC